MTGGLLPDELFELKLLFMRELAAQYAIARHAHEAFCRKPSDSSAIARLRSFFHRIAGTAPTVGLAVLGHTASICERVAQQVQSGAYTTADQAALLFADGLSAVAVILDEHSGAPVPRAPAVDIDGLVLPTPLGEGRELSRVFVIDDDAFSARLIDDCLRSAGFVSSYCCDAEHALRMVHEELPDLIVLDVDMPNLDGFELCRRVRAHPALQFTPIVFVTRKGDVEQRVRGLEVGGSDYIAKPFEPQELIARVRSQLMRLASLRELAIRDGLTRCYNHKYFRLRVEQEVSRAQRYAEDMSLALLEVGQLRALGESRGYAVADAVLIQVANVMFTALRSTDVLARYGGDLFGVLLAHAGFAEAEIVCHRLRHRIQNHQFEVPDSDLSAAQVPLGTSVPVTMAITALSPKEDTWSSLLDRTWTLLQHAKERGQAVISRA
jgi:diguanylate cyclase (GGDEF)-like protein